MSAVRTKATKFSRIKHEPFTICVRKKGGGGGGVNYVFMQCCSPFNLIAEKSEMVKAVKDQENRESIIFYFSFYYLLDKHYSTINNSLLSLNANGR